MPQSGPRAHTRQSDAPRVVGGPSDSAEQEEHKEGHPETDDLIHLDRPAAAFVLPVTNTDDDFGHWSTQVS